MNVMDAIRCRHSYRGKYKDTPVSREDLVQHFSEALTVNAGYRLIGILQR